MELPESFRSVEFIILDMDGVITSEESYWDAAGLVVQEILESPAFLGLSPPHYKPILDLYYQPLIRSGRSNWRKYLPSQLITNCKARGINSNWDLAYLVLGLYLVPLFGPLLNQFSHGILREIDSSLFPDTEDSSQPVLPADRAREMLKDCLQPVWDDLHKRLTNNEHGTMLRAGEMHLWGSFFRHLGHTINPVQGMELRLVDDFHPDVRGLRLLDELNTLTSKSLAHRKPWFGRRTSLWDDCRDLFQSWYLGEELYEQTYDKKLLFGDRPGLIHEEEPLHGRQATHECLFSLIDSGYKLGIATGRPRMEIMTPLKQWNLLNYFREHQIATHDEVEAGETALQKKGITDLVGKPHPYVFLKSAFPRKKPAELFEMAKQPVPNAETFLVVGDAQADIWAAKEMGCPSVAVLSGAIGPQARRSLEDAEPDVICNDILELSHALAALKRAQ